MKNHTRLGTVLAVALAAAALSATLHADPLADADNAKLKVRPVIPLQARAFPLEEVRLLDGPFKHAMDMDRQYLLMLDVDRLLHTFRVNAGLPSSASPLGGWEEPKGELRGHFAGHYLSACALMYASTGDPRVKEKGNALVAGLAACQEKLGSGYLSAYPEEFFDRVEAQKSVWAPYYTLHKIYAGLLDMYVYCDNAQALEVCKKFADWVIARNARLTDEQMQRMLGNEHGGMNEVLANLYGLTGEAKYLKIAQRFNHHAVLDPASRREDKLTGLHANTQIPKFIGTARQYELTGEDWLGTASKFFWDTVVHERSYVIGGHSDGEGFSPKEKLSEAFGPSTTETCNTYNMLKLTRHLFCWEPRVEYAEYYERALFNHILASQNPADGMTCYYVPLRNGSHKEYCTPNDSFWCCTGTGIENHAKYGDSIYFHHDDILYVNLFLASELNWKAKGVQVRQETQYPDEDRSKLVFRCAKPTEFNLHLRYPHWATVSGMEIRVNGQELRLADVPGTWVAIKRVWNDGDVVEITMPFTLRTEGFKDNPNRFAYLNGPVVLAAGVDTRKPFPAVIAEDGKWLTGFQPVAGQPNTFVASGLFRIPGEPKPTSVTLEPFYKIHGQRSYEVYWDRFTSAQWVGKEAEYQAQLARQREYEARTVDYVEAGMDQNERDHKFQGENTEVREFNDRKFRSASTNGWFSWELKVLPDQPQELCVQYGGGRGSRFEVLADGIKLTAEPASAPQRGLGTNVYALSADMLKGKTSVTVKIQAPANGRTSGIYVVRILKTKAGAASAAAPAPTQAFLKLRAVPFTEVQIKDAFWAPRREANRKVSIPVNFENLEKSGNLPNLRLAGQGATNGFIGPVFMDSDVYKALEAASYSLATDPDPELDKRVDEIIAILAAAQRPDGYLDSYYTVKEPGRRWTNLRDNHELYCAGHLFEAAVAHYQATHKRNFLNVATQLADHIDTTFGPGKRMGYPGHPEIELALVKLWRVTGERRYFELARFFVENRGRKFFAEEHRTSPDQYDGTYWQDDMPIFDHKTIKGHAVRAAYLLSGVVDVMGETRDPRLVRMVDRVWRNTVLKNMYITGGIGPSGSNEGFTTDYDLPNLTAYQETCASVALALWNHRLALLYGDASYADVFERSLYNGTLDGVSLDGKRFFYVNPLASTGRHHRSGWFGCACCPPNVARTLASLGGYAYAVADDALYVNLYIQGAVNTPVAGHKIAMKVTTDYPWDGRVTLEPNPESPATFELRLRVPGWCEGATVAVNREKVANPRVERGYLVLAREWRAGDVVALDLPMPVQRVAANPQVKADQGLLALQRGPLIYCLEACDHTEPITSMYLPANAELRAEKNPDLLGGVTVIKGLAELAPTQDWNHKLYQAAPATRQTPLTAIPYYAWDNRQACAMQVWMPLAPPTPPVGGPEAHAKAEASSPTVPVEAIHDGIEPKNSQEHPGALCHFWPRLGSEEWIQYTWPRPASFRGSKVYWFDDTGSGACRVPEWWRLEYRDGQDWKPVKTADAYSVALDKWCEIRFDPVTTTSLRLVLKMKPDFSVGIHEWKVTSAEED